VVGWGTEACGIQRCTIEGSFLLKRVLIVSFVSAFVLSLVASSAVAAPPETNPNYTTIDINCDGETLTLVETGGAVAFVQGTSQPGIALFITVFQDTDGDGDEEVVFQSTNQIGKGVEGRTVLCTGSFVDEGGVPFRIEVVAFFPRGT
jgi:hypothetical protein